MNTELMPLLASAAFLGFTHTLAGPDHYVPFIAMSKARNWSIGKTSLITFLCGLGHVLGSVILGGVGIAIGSLLNNLEATEGVRGDIAGWLLTAFGLVYMIWGIKKAYQNKPHSHAHISENSEDGSKKKASITPWVLFLIFVFGPCECLIPLLMFPAAQHSTMGIALVATVFGVVTIATMMTMVLAATLGFKKLRVNKLSRVSHALAGASLLACGIMICVGF